MSQNQEISIIGDNCGKYKPNTKPYNLSNGKFILTYKNILFDKRQLFDYLIKILKKNVNILKTVHIAHERTNTTNYTHVFILFNKIFRTELATYFDIDLGDQKFPCIIRVLNGTNIQLQEICKCFAQCDPECKYLTSSLQIDESEVQNNDDQSVINSVATSSSNSTGNMSVSNATSTQKIQGTFITGCRWQNDLIDELNAPATTKIAWYIPDNDNKSFYPLFQELTLYLKTSKDASDFLVITDLIDDHTLYNIVVSCIKDRTWSGKTILINASQSILPQVEQEKLTLWLSNALMIIKNRLITKTNYNPKSIVLKELPHVIVFSTFRPYSFAIYTDMYIELRSIENNYKYSVISTNELIDQNILILTPKEHNDILALREGKVRLAPV